MGTIVGLVGQVGNLRKTNIAIRETVDKQLEWDKNKFNCSNKRIKFISILGIVHVLSMIIYCMSQSFLAHNSGNIFYFFVLFLFYAFMVNESTTTSE